MDENGQPIPKDNSHTRYGWFDGWSYEMPPMTPEDIEQAMELLNAARRSDTFNGNGVIMMIISEEAEAFYKDQRSVDETAGIIQERVALYLKENKS